MEKDTKNYFLLRKYELIIKNAMMYFNVIHTFKPMRKDLLELVSLASTISDITFLEKDTENSKKYLSNLKKVEPRLNDEIDAQLIWIDEVLSYEITKQKKIIYRQKGKSITESYLNILMETDLVKEKLQPVYLLLTFTGTILSKIIKFSTNQPYSHVSISFDSGLENMYSFGRKDSNQIATIIEKESYKAGLLGQVAPNANYALYCIFLPNDAITRIKNRIDEIIKVKNIRFSFRGLINIKFNRISNYENEYFCSQFIAELLQKGDPNLITRHTSLYTPYDLTFIPNVHFISNGILSEYDKKYTDKKIEEFKILE